MFDITETLEKFSENDMRKIKYISNKILEKIGGIYQMDYDDFYSIANTELYKLAKKYNEQVGATFEQYYITCLKNKFKTELTRRNRQKRIPIKNVIYIDVLIEDEKTISKNSFHNTICDDYNLEQDVCNRIDGDSSEGFYKFINSLHGKQKLVAELISKGYESQDIKHILNISTAELHNAIDSLKSFETITKLKKYIH